MSCSICTDTSPHCRSGTTTRNCWRPSGTVLSSQDVAAVIIEPIQGEGGDRHASAEFFRGLRRLTSQYGTAFVVDEVQTGGGGTGRWWYHETWNLPEPPDLMSFSKRMQIGGYYCREAFHPADAYRIFNTFLGDPLRTARLGVIVEVIERDGRNHPILRGVGRTVVQVLGGGQGGGTADRPSALRSPAMRPRRPTQRTS